MGDKTTVDFEDLPKLQYMAAVGYFFGHNFVMVQIAGFFLLLFNPLLSDHRSSTLVLNDR